MSARKSVYSIVDRPCDGGESPNAYVPKITAEVRLHFPPTTAPRHEVLNALDASYRKAFTQVVDYFDELRDGR